MQYKIPQNIGIEDKIVGPFSLRQLIIVAAGGGISYVIFVLASGTYELNVLEYIVIALPFILSLAIALIKINNITFTKFILLALEFAIKPKRRLWDHRGISPLVAPNLKEEELLPKSREQPKKTLQKKINLKDLSRILDSAGFRDTEITHQDMDNAQDEDLITEAFFGHKRSESETQNMYWRTKASQKKRLDILSKIQANPTISK